MSGIDVSRIERIRDLSAPLAGLLQGWLSEDRWSELESAPHDSRLSAGRQLVRGLRWLAEDSDISFQGRAKSELVDLLAVAGAGYALTAAAEMDGFDQLYQKLESLAEAGEFEQFLDTLFEVEAAVYFRDEFRASVRFEPTHHPDLWVGRLYDGHVINHPCECKRIEPKDRVQQQHDTLVADIDRFLQSSGTPPVKILLHLHCPAEDVSRESVCELISSMVDEAEADPERWFTASGQSGLWQLSLQSVGELGEMKRRPIDIDDVAARGSMAVRVGTIYEASEQDPAAMRSLVRVQSDVLPNRIGAFERNLHKAIRQLERTSDYHEAGLVAIRLRPPRGLGDLYEAEQIVRRVLDESGVDHVALAMLVWNEGEDARKKIDGEDAYVRTVAYHLQPHFVWNPNSRFNFSSIDSGQRRFSESPGALSRDPGTGELVPSDLSLLDDPSLGTDLSKDDHKATLYFSLTGPYDGTALGPLPGYIRAPFGQLMFTVGADWQLRCLEFNNRQLNRLATVDLRAWAQESELLFWIHWTQEVLSVGMPTSDGEGRVDVRAVPVRGVYV